VPQEGHGTPVIVLIGQTVISFVLALETKKWYASQTYPAIEAKNNALYILMLFKVQSIKKLL
jgi:hypothetical protein